MTDLTTMRPDPSSSRSHAVVIGAGMAGLLTARVLADSCGRVTVLDRDELPQGPAARRGVPQGRHTHGLLARGREAMEQLLPGMTDDLVAQGALTGDLQQDCRWIHDGRVLRQAPSGLRGLLVSRPLLETYLAGAVASWPRVTVYDAVSVLDLVFDDEAREVLGVRVESQHPDRPQGQLAADLVVDASGRTSRLPAWLDRRGYPVPDEEKVRIDVSYATRTFRRTPGDLSGDLAVVVAATRESPRAAALLAQEGQTWTASLCGYHGERPPIELDGFLAYARRLGDPTIAELLSRRAPLDDGATYRFAANVRRRYETVPRFPEGLLLLGDALCSFDPVYGQGMTAAALEAVALQECLRFGGHDLAHRFFRSAAKLVDIPWAIAVGGDLDLPQTAGRRTIQTRLTNAYVRAVLRAGRDDPALAAAFLRVANLIDRPEALLAPRTLSHVLRTRLWPRRQAVEGTAELAQSTA